MSPDDTAKTAPQQEARDVDAGETNALSTTLPKKRDVIINRPGNINYAGDRGHFPGCRIVLFGNDGVYGLEAADSEKFYSQVGAESTPGEPWNPAKAVNTYFKYRANLLTVAVSAGADGIVVVFTNQLEDEELDEFQEFTREWGNKQREREAKRAEEAQKKRDEEKARNEEMNALVALGKKARDHNLVDKLRELDEENKRLRAELGRYKKDEKKRGGK